MIKRLCLYTTEFAFNRQIMLNYLEDILPKSIEIFLFVPPKFRNRFSVKRANIVETKSNKFLSFFELRKFCKNEKIDRIVNLGVLPQEGFVMFFSSIFNNTDFIMFFVGNPWYFYKFGFTKDSIKSLLELITSFPLSIFPQKMIVSSKDVCDIYKKYFFFSKRKTHFLPLTVDTSLFIPKDKIKSRKKLGIRANEKVIIYLGRVEHMKGSEIILDLAKRNSDIQFVLVGSVNPRVKIPELENLKIIPPKSSKELVDYYNSADLCIFPSRIEGFGLVPREAMACGTPALVSDIMSLRLIEPAFKSKLNTESMEKQIKKFFSLSSKEKEVLSKKSREFVIQECDMKVFKEKYIELISH